MKSTRRAKRFYFGKNMKNIIKKLTIFTILISLSLVVLACLKKPAANTNQPINANQPGNVNKNVSIIYDDIEDGLYLYLFDSLREEYPWLHNLGVKKGKIFWRREEGPRMALYNAEVLSGSVVDVDRISDLSSFFEKNGFISNKENTGEELLYGDFYTYRIAFMKGDLRCVVYWTNNESYVNIGFAEYSDADEKIYQEFKSLFSNGNVYWSVDKYDDNFAIGNYSPASGGGSNWYAKKVDNKWQIFLNTQEDPYCSILKKNNVPDTFYIGECWQDDGRTKFFYSS